MSFIIKGLTICPGIARGQAFIISPEFQIPVPRRTIEENKLGAELDRFDESLKVADRELQALERQIGEKIGAEEAAIVDVQTLVLRDPSFRVRVTDLIREERINAEFALSEVVKQLSRGFSEIVDPYFRERGADIRDIGRRVLSILVRQEGVKHPVIPNGAIIVAEEMFPSMLAHMELENNGGIVTQRGGRSSHAAILARSFGTPAVTGVPEAVKRIKTGDYVIIDALAGTIFVNPGRSVLREYEKLEVDFQTSKESLKQFIDVPTRTLDGVEVKLQANIGKLADSEAAALFKPDGVGLFRTEFAFAIRDHFPTEDEQYRVYKGAAERLDPKPVVFRLLDIGADKTLSYFPLRAAVNPALSERGMRLLLKHSDILQDQIKAILRVSADHPVSILLPMVTNLEEAVEVQRLIESAQAELSVKGFAFNPRTPLGCMIETPAAALTVKLLAQAFDFFSLGTNDLVQYLLAADRDDETMASYYNPLHPAVLHTIYSVATTAAAQDKELSICGEMAGDPSYTALLLGLGLRSFSVAPSQILEVKKAICSTRLEQAQALAQRALSLPSAGEIDVCLKKGCGEGSIAPTVPAGRAQKRQGIL